MAIMISFVDREISEILCRRNDTFFDLLIDILYKKLLTFTLFANLL